MILQENLLHVEDKLSEVWIVKIGIVFDVIIGVTCHSEYELI